ncbi:MAG TPA: ABC transporter permease subunit, partial [Erysipelothrix sp.]|nr:ABC transporter permease subunit [Erysipelothrix sp.]
DGTVAVNGLKGNPVEARIPEELKDGSTNVVQIAATSDNGIAIDDKGGLHIWGTSSGPATIIPEGLEGNVEKIIGSKGHFTALKTDGSVVAWGINSHEQIETGKLDGNTYEDIYSSYYQSYAVDSSQKATGFGFKGFLLGSDDWGRDVAIRLIHGGRITMFVGIIAVFISTIIGVAVGLIAGFYGGRVDNLLMRIAEIVSSFPFLPLAITLSTMLSEVLSQSQRLFMVMIILGIISWPGLARMIRGQILAEREKDFVLAAQALGLSTNKIMIKHILPAVFNIIIVTMTLSYAGNLLTESGLSFLGFGVAAPQPSWGNMLTTSQSAKVIEFYWWEWVLPALMVLMAALSINLVGDGLRDAMDPKTSDH